MSDGLRHLFEYESEHTSMLPNFIRWGSWGMKGAAELKIAKKVSGQKMSPSSNS
jgi:hypothetical protein